MRIGIIFGFCLVIFLFSSYNAYSYHNSQPTLLIEKNIISPGDVLAFRDFLTLKKII